MKYVDDEQEVLDSLKSGRNTFITGSAGSGKTYLASAFARSFNNVALTATTGVAAINVGGETIHRLLGLGIASRDFEAGKIIGKWKKIEKSSAPWDVTKWRTIQSIKTIVIDEISMLRRDQFELIDIVLSAIKDNPLPFGGVQMVLVGDFFQLPPVVTASDAFKFKDLSSPYCFQSPLWKQSNFNSFNLQTNYRQEEGDFLDILEDIRVGNVSDRAKKILKSRLNTNLNIPMEPVKLFSHKETVNTENIECLKGLPGDKMLSTAEFTGKKYDVDILEKECPADKKLYFCKGAQVMMLTNEVRGEWVNGTLGIIDSVDPVKITLSNGVTITSTPHKWERVVHKVSAKGSITTHSVASMTQYPFKLAYATTIHKSQGLTLDYIDIDLGNCFTSGQAYVALSRAKTIEGLRLRGWNPESVKADPRVKKFYGIKC